MKVLRLGMFEVHCDELIRSLAKRAEKLHGQLMMKMCRDHQEENKRSDVVFSQAVIWFNQAIVNNHYYYYYYKINTFLLFRNSPLADYSIYVLTLALFHAFSCLLCYGLNVRFNLLLLSF